MGYYEAKHRVELDYDHLREGQSEAGQVCPSCSGGPKKEGSFSVSRSRGTLLYNCHRASCKFSGAIGSLADHRGEALTSKGAGSRAYIPTTQLDEQHVKFLAEEFGLSRESIEFAGLKWVGSDAGFYSRRICSPIFGPDLRERGASYRSYEGRTPKSIIRLTDDDAITMSWYIRKRRSKALVIVEDQISAIKVSEFYDSVALLSVNFSTAKVNEVKQRGYQRVYLCLDNDATSVAVKLAISLRATLPQLQIIGLAKDIKNMDKEEFKEFLTRLEE